jgi:hypothetical protein
MMDIYSFYLCRLPTILFIIISTHLPRLLKARRDCHVFRLALRAFRRHSYRICVMSDLPGREWRCDGVVTYLPLTNAPDKRDGLIEQRQDVRRCPGRVERRVECEDAVFMALHGGYMMDIYSFYLCRPPTTLIIIISTHLSRLLKARRDCHVFRLALRAFRRLSCCICVMSELLW